MTLPAPAPISAGGGGGGGGGGLTAEADPLLWYDAGADEYYLRNVVYAADGSVDSVALTDAAGAVYVPVGPSQPAGISLSNPNPGSVTLGRIQNGSLNSTAGALAVHFIVHADGVTVDGVAWPAGTGHTFDLRPDRRVPAVAFVADATGDVVIVQELL